MRSEDIEAFCKRIIYIEDPKLINQQLVKISKEDLLGLTNRFLKNPFQFKQALAFSLQRLFDDTPEFAELLNNFFEKTCSDYACGALYEPLREKLSEKQNQAFSLLKRMMHLGNIRGIPSGILLSWIVQEFNEAEKFMIEGLSSTDSDIQRCSLVAFCSVICNVEMHEKSKYFEILKEITPKILQENTNHLIICLQCAYEERPDELEPILGKEVTRRGSEAAKDYIRFTHYRPRVSISVLQKAVEILESEDPENDIVNMGLGRIYEYNQDFVIERLQKRLSSRKCIKFAEGYLLHKINEIGSEPVLKMIESEIDNRNPVLLNIGQDILEDFFPHFEVNINWIAWCEKWKDDHKKESVILKSLGLILSKLINYKSSEIRDRAITLVKGFAIKKGIDYKAETNRINLKSDLNEGKENKENAIKALYILERILNPPDPIDVKTLSENLKRAPHLSKAIGAEWLIENANLREPHPFVYIFDHKSPNGLSKYQLYWENVFKILMQHNIKISRSKLQDSPNAWSTLAEAEVFSRLAPYFTINIEPDIPELNPKKLDALIEYGDEKVLIEIAAVQEKLEESLAHGVVSSIPGGKAKSVLSSKLKKQLKEGKTNPRLPILIILCLEGFMGYMDMSEVRNAIYGALQFSFKQRKDTHEIVEEGATREENAFYDNPGTEIVTAIGAYWRDSNKDDPLVGKLYHPYKPPINKMSQKFKLRLRNALFGTSEISDWKSLMRVPKIDEQTAQLLYANGIEDLGVLASIQENEYGIDNVTQEKLLQLQKEAIRVINAISTGSIKFLKGIDQKTFTVLQNNGIYLITKLLEQEIPPEGVSYDTWISLKEDARRILA